MTQQEYLQNIRDLIAKDDVTSAIAWIKELLAHTPLLNEVLHQSGRYENIAKQIRLGTVNPKEAHLELNQIRAALLDLVAEIEKQGEGAPLHKEIKRAVSVVNSKNLLVDPSINAHTVSIGDRTEIHHHYGEKRTKPATGLKIGAAIVTVIGVLAGIAGFTGFSLKDIWSTQGEPITMPSPDSSQIKADSAADHPAATKPQAPTQPSSLKKTVTSPRNHFESRDSSKQINIPDNQGTIQINQ